MVCKGGRFVFAAVRSRAEEGDEDPKVAKFCDYVWS